MKIDDTRFAKRELAIKNWLIHNNGGDFLSKANGLLDNLPKEKILAEFVEEISGTLAFCCGNNEIGALDFSWHYSGDLIGGAYAYGLDSCETEGELSNTDLGPEEIPGIEVELEHGDLVEEDFAELPVYHAINTWVKELKNDVALAVSEGKLGDDAETLLLDLFQIWNFRLAHEACAKCDYDNELKKRSPFWVTMTRHERWSVPIWVYGVSRR